MSKIEINFEYLKNSCRFFIAPDAIYLYHIYNKYFKEVIQKDISINGWYFKEFSSLENIPHIEEYTLFTV